MNHTEWLQARRAGIAGVDISVLLGANPYKTEDDLLLDKLGVSAPFRGNDATRAGQRLEPFVASLWSRENGVIITPGEFTISRENSRYIGTPDFLCGTGNGLEIKTGAEKVYRSGIPRMYQLQCAWYAMITERPEWDLKALIVPKDRSLIPLDLPDEDLFEWVESRPTRSFHYERDLDLESQMKERADQFLARLDGLRRKR